MTELFLVLLGVVLGSFTGLIPGLHTNLLCVILLAYSIHFSDLGICLLIISMSIAHSFVSILPSVFLGIPEEGTVFALLPGHKLAMNGFGFEAVKLYLIGALFSLIFTLIFLPVILYFLPKIFLSVKNHIKIILFCIVCILILKEPEFSKKIVALFVFLSSGVLGYLTFNLVGEPLLVLFSGFFGVSSLLFSWSCSYPKQFITDIIRLKKQDVCFSLFFTVFSCSLINLFPGLGVSQSLSLSRFFSSRINNYVYLFMTGGVHLSDVLFSLITFYLFGKHRNGSIVAISSFFPEISSSYFFLFTCVIILSAGLAVAITLFLVKLVIRSNILFHLRVINKFVLLFIFILVFYFSGFIGIFVLFLSTLIGTIAQLTGVCRSHCMGCLLLVVLLGDTYV